MADLEALDDFNGTIKKLVRFAVSKSRRLDWGGAVKRVKMLLDDAPLAAISALGPGLCRYRAQVMSSDEKYFMSADLSKDIPDEFAGNKKEVEEVIDIIKNVYLSCSAVEQKEILGDLKRLLVCFDTYTTLTRVR